MACHRVINGFFGIPLLLVLLVSTKFLFAVQLEGKTDSYQITPYNSDPSPGGPPSLVPGARSCGGSGTLLYASNPHCLTDQSTFPCVLPPTGSSGADSFQIVFVPQESTPRVIVREKIIPAVCKTCPDVFLSTEKLLPLASLKAGEDYVFTRKMDFISELPPGTRFFSRVEILRDDADKTVEICSLTDYFVEGDPPTSNRTENEL